MWLLLYMKYGSSLVLCMKSWCFTKWWGSNWDFVKNHSQNISVYLRHLDYETGSVNNKNVGGFWYIITSHILGAYFSINKWMCWSQLLQEGLMSMITINFLIPTTRETQLPFLFSGQFNFFAYSRNILTSWSPWQDQDVLLFFLHDPYLPLPRVYSFCSTFFATSLSLVCSNYLGSATGLY